MKNPTKDQMRISRRLGVRRWRVVVVGAVTVPLVVGAMSSVALAATTPRHGAMGSATTTALPAGSYSGGVNFTSDEVAFYVSNKMTALQNITIGGLGLNCDPSGSVNLSNISVDSIPLKRNGSFRKTSTEHGVYQGESAAYKISFQGKAQGLKNGEPVVVGSVTESLKPAHGGSCTSAPQAWTVTRDASQTVTTGAPPAGSFTGSVNFSSDEVAFYVSNKMTALQNITMGQLDLPCAPGGSTSHSNISIDSVPLKRNGSFNTTTTEQGVFAGVQATFEITFQGYFHGLNSQGVARAAGSISETMTYTTGGTSYSCSSGPEVPWTVTRDAGQTVTAGAPPAGSFTGSVNFSSDEVAFYVSNKMTALQNITMGQLDLPCAPGGSTSHSNISIDSVPLNSDGSFNTTTTEQGVFAGVPATFEITFQGYFHGLNSQGVARAAGSISETMTYTTGGTSYSCSSGPEVPWTVTRDASQTVTTGAPPAGSYAGGVNFTSDGVAFSVANSETALQNVTVGGLPFNCAPSGTTSLSNISIDSVPLNSDGSFNTTATEQGVFAGVPATFEITFQGYFHGLNADGVARAAGSISETMTYTTSGTSYSCSSGPEFPWTVAHS